jgi:hypothetical protein
VLSSARGGAGIASVWWLSDECFGRKEKGPRVYKAETAIMRNMFFFFETSPGEGVVFFLYDEPIIYAYCYIVLANTTILKKNSCRQR